MTVRENIIATRPSKCVEQSEFYGKLGNLYTTRQFITIPSKGSLEMGASWQGDWMAVGMALALEFQDAWQDAFDCNFDPNQMSEFPCTWFFAGLCAPTLYGCQGKFERIEDEADLLMFKFVVRGGISIDGWFVALYECLL